MPFEPLLSSQLVDQELQNLQRGMSLLLTEDDATLDQCLTLLTTCAARLADLFADLCPAASDQRETARSLAYLFLKARDRLK